MKAIIGVDPGTKGGLALMIGGTPVEWAPMPNTAAGVKDWLEMAWGKAVMAECDLIMVVEYQQPMVGKGKVNVNATATMMRKFGQWEIFALMLKLPYHEVTPSGWKKRMGVTTDKATSIQLCERLFPEINLVLKGCRTRHDGIAEAILICEDSRRRDL